MPRQRKAVEIWKGIGILIVAIMLFHYFPLIDRTPHPWHDNQAMIRGVIFYVAVIGGLLYLAYGN